MTEYYVNGFLRNLNSFELANLLNLRYTITDLKGEPVDGGFTPMPKNQANPLSKEAKYKKGAEEARIVEARYRREDLSWMERSDIG